MILSQEPWLTPIILATQEAEIRRSRYKTSKGKQFSRPYLEKNSSQKRTVEWLKV
jgi:hypothetical protein